ncbi:MAG: hypothetical protein ACI823_001456 [Chitinophagales bacterium]|jgi:hypothetical protein
MPFKKRVPIANILNVLGTDVVGALETLLPPRAPIVEIKTARAVIWYKGCKVNLNATLCFAKHHQLSR